MLTRGRHQCYQIDVSLFALQQLHYEQEHIGARLSCGIHVIMLLILHVYILSCLSSHFQRTPWLMSHWVWGAISALVNDTVCACTPSTPSHTPLTITPSMPAAPSKRHSPAEELVCSRCPSQLPTWRGLLEKHHSHRQGPKLIKSTVDSVKRKVYPSHFLLSGNGTQCLVVIASLCHAESSHILMNAAICMRKQLLRVYQSKLLYLEWTWPHQWLVLVNKPLSI